MIKTTGILGLVLCIGMLFTGQLFANNDPTREGFRLFQQAEYFDAGDKTFKVEEIIRKSDQLPFKPVESSNLNIGFTTSHYWVRFSLVNNDSVPHQYFLETARPITDTVILYQVSNQRVLKMQQSGDRMPFNDRAIAHRASLFSINLPAHSNHDFYLHLTSDGEVIALPLRLFRPEEMIVSTYREQWVYGFFYGVLALAAIVYLFFFTSLSDYSFLYYGFYVIFIGMLQLSLDGYIYQYIMPGGGFLSGRMVMISAMISVFFLGRYAETFLRIGTHLPWLRYVYLTLYILTGLLLLGALVSDKILEMSYPLVNQIGLVLLLTIIFSVVRLQVKKVSVDPFFSIGISFLVLGFVVFILNNLGIIPNTFITANSTKFGSGLEVIFLSLSMTNRIRKLRTDKEKSQAMALRKSEELNELKSNFMSNMSHELRTPLNAILGIAESMSKNDQLPPLVKSNFEVIRYSSNSLLSSVNDIFDFERIEKGELVLNKSRFRLLDPIVEISENWRALAQDKGLFYQVNIDENLPEYCEGDPDRLRQILNNIIGNAVKFTPRGNVVLRASQVKGNNADFRLKISVADTGVGISQNKLETIFESFSQQQMSDKRQFGGLGLGLSIVRKLIDLHGGKIDINSEEGFGTEVLVELPLTEVARKLETDHKFNTEDKDLQGAEILVVEDNALNQLIMRKVLSSWSQTRFSIVDDGAQALEALRSQSFDIILMDLQMPVMDGYEATQAIRTNPEFAALANIPIIAVTADTLDETRRRVFALGFDDYLTKPVKADDLYDKIAAQLSRKAG